MKEINMNDVVYVRLTKRGHDILRSNHDRLPTISEYQSPKEDADGWSRWQLWCLFEEFGEYTHNGFNIPFETTIRIADK